VTVTTHHLLSLQKQDAVLYTFLFYVVGIIKWGTRGNNCRFNTVVLLAVDHPMSVCDKWRVKSVSHRKLQALSSLVRFSEFTFVLLTKIPEPVEKTEC
jgi:hypothetical protein